MSVLRVFLCAALVAAASAATVAKPPPPHKAPPPPACMPNTVMSGTVNGLPNTTVFAALMDYLGSQSAPPMAATAMWQSFLPASGGATMFLPNDQAFSNWVSTVGIMYSPKFRNTTLFSKVATLINFEGAIPVSSSVSYNMSTEIAPFLLSNHIIPGQALMSSSVPSISANFDPMNGALKLGMFGPNEANETYVTAFNNGSVVTIVGTYNTATVASADHKSCGGVVIHVVNDLLWPLPPAPINAFLAMGIAYVFPPPPPKPSPKPVAHPPPPKTAGRRAAAF